MRSFEQIFDTALREATKEAMGELVGECDVCRWGISRAEMYVLNKYKPATGFGCTQCVVTGRVAPWGQK